MVDFDDLLKQREKAKRMIAKYSAKLADIENQINSNCEHKKTKVLPYNVEGGYLNVAEYHKILICETCGKELDRKIKYGSYA